MENKTKNNLKTLKSLCLSKARGPWDFLSIVGLCLMNLFLLPGLWTTAETSFFGADGIYSIMILVIMFGIYLALAFMTPCVLRCKLKDCESIPFWLKLLSLWLPFCLYITAQTLIFLVCLIVSKEFEISFVTLVLTYASMLTIVFFWIIIYAFLYYNTKQIKWYVLGVLALNFAPSVIAETCSSLYTLNPLISGGNVNPHDFSLFFISYWLSVWQDIALFRWAFGGILVFIGLFVFVAYLREKNRLKINRQVFSSIYKFITVLLVALYIASILSNAVYANAVGSVSHEVTFACIALTVSGIMSFYAFRKNKPFIKTAIVLLVTLLSSLFIFGMIPVFATRTAYSLPKEEDIESIEIALDLSLNKFDVYKHFDQCLELHRSLLDIFEEGYLPSERNGEYVESKCIGISFRYNLKNGQVFYRSYAYLNDKAFDKFFIEFYKSDLYEYSLKNTSTDDPKIIYDPKEGSLEGCKLPEECVKKFLDTYCEELKNADDSFFYEAYDSVRLERFYENGLDRMIHLPRSFTKTRALIFEYTETYEPW